MAIVNAADTTRAAVGTALALCNDGDTLVIPAGGPTDWTSTLTISKAITLTGTGTTLDGNGRATACATIITTGTADGTPLIVWNLVANQASRMADIEFRGGTVPDNYYQAIWVNGTNIDSRTMRVDHCVFTLGLHGAFNIETTLGVCDHCTVTGRTAGTTAWVGYVKGSSWGGAQGSNSFGDGSWAAADQLGTVNAWYWEDNNLTNNYTGGHLTMIDSQNGGRYVARYNTVTKGSFESHGLEAQRERSGRAFEIYHNIMIGDDTQQNVIYMRGGVGVVYLNTITNYGTTAQMYLVNNRSNEAEAQPFGGSDGRNPWDVNASAGTVTGTASAVGTLTVTDNTKSWTVDQFAGYTVRRTSGLAVSALVSSSGLCTATSTGHGLQVPQTINSLTSVGTTATATISGGHNFTTGFLVRISGVATAGYNGDYAITVTGATTFTFVITGASSPASGTMVASRQYIYGVFGAVEQPFNSIYTITVTSANAFTFFNGYTANITATGTIKAAPGGYFSEIVSNTATQLTFRASVFGAAYQPTFAVSDTFEINLVTFSMDMCGRSGGSDLGGVDSPSVPGGWNNQTTSAWYGWDNKADGSGVNNVDFSPLELIIVGALYNNNANTAKPGYAPLVYPHPLISGATGVMAVGGNATVATLVLP